MTNALAVYDEMDLPTIAEAMFKSGLFSDTKSMAQAVVKVIAGRELGIGPVAAMRGIDIIQGKVALSASLTAALVKQTGRYTYYVVEHDAKVCSIEFHERDATTGGWSPIGTSTFTMEMAERAGLVSKGVWTQYPEAMLWARAMTQGAGWFCPDATEGRFYTAEELGADEAPEGSGSPGEVVTHASAVPDALSDEAEEAVTDEPVPPASAPTLDNMTPNDENPLTLNTEALLSAREQLDRVVTLYGGQSKAIRAAWEMFGIEAKDLPSLVGLTSEQAEQMIRSKGGL